MYFCLFGKDHTLQAKLWNYLNFNQFFRVEEGRGDLTGGAGGEIDMRSAQAQIDLVSGRLWLLRFKQEGFLLGAGSPSGSDVHISSSGIVQGHAYSLLQVGLPFSSDYTVI